MKRIFTILDKPKHPQAALDLSVKLMERAGSALSLASFCYDPLADDENVAVETRRVLKRALRDDRRRWLQALLQDDDRFTGRTLPQPIRQRVVWTAAIDDWVAANVSSTSADLIIKTSHPAGDRFLHEPLDWGLLMKAPVPIWFANSKPRRRKQLSGPVLATIDLRRDDSQHERLNRAVLKAATQAAQVLETNVHCVCVVESSKILRDLDLIDSRAHRQRFLKRAQPRLQALSKEYDIPKSALHFPTGKVGQCVMQVAGKIRAPLLVVGTSAKRRRQKFGIGNSAQKIVSRIDRDVLAVHG
ncbi:MAG: universal stress protein [Pseudomonadota bacterium]